VHINASEPSIAARGSTTKNDKNARITMLGDLAGSLERTRPRKHSAADKVFPGGILEIERFKDLLDSAGIPYRDAQGRRFDFHALRRTFCTLLHRWNLPEASIMHFMRVGERRLIDKTYLDTGLLLQAVPTWVVPWSLPRSQGRSQTLDASALGLSRPVGASQFMGDENHSAGENENHVPASVVAASHSESGNWGTRIRT